MNDPPRILVADDAATARALICDLVEEFGYVPVPVTNGREALERLDTDIDLVLLDYEMPEMNGFQFLEQVRSGEHGCTDVPVIMVTGHDSHEHRLQAVQAGATDYVGKPVDVLELRIRLQATLQARAAQEEVRRYQQELEELVDERTAALRQALEEAERAKQAAMQAHLDTVQRLAVTAEYKDPETHAHVVRVGKYCALLAELSGLSPDEVNTLELAAPLHDVGKMGIPDAILLKPGKLTAEEWEVMKTHTTIGAAILAGSDSPYLAAGRLIAAAHHEKWDGSGYPEGLHGEAIHIYGRICAIADVFDALTSERPYKAAFSNEKAQSIMVDGRGKHFDPTLLDLFFANFDQVERIQNENRAAPPSDAPEAETEVGARR